MPCDTIISVETDLKNADIGLLIKALAGLGAVSLNYGSNGILKWYGGAFDKSTGELELTSPLTVESVKRAYSKEVVSHTAKRYGWAVSESGGKLNLKKRY